MQRRRNLGLGRHFLFASQHVTYLWSETEDVSGLDDLSGSSKSTLITQGWENGGPERLSKVMMLGIEILMLFPLLLAPEGVTWSLQLLRGLAVLVWTPIPSFPRLCNTLDQWFHDGCRFLPMDLATHSKAGSPCQLFCNTAFKLASTNILQGYSVARGPVVTSFFSELARGDSPPPPA